MEEIIKFPTAFVAFVFHELMWSSSGPTFLFWTETSTAWNLSCISEKEKGVYDIYLKINNLFEKELLTIEKTSLKIIHARGYFNWHQKRWKLLHMSLVEIAVHCYRNELNLPSNLGKVDLKRRVLFISNIPRWKETITYLVSHIMKENLYQVGGKKGTCIDMNRSQ